MAMKEEEVNEVFIAVEDNFVLAANEREATPEFQEHVAYFGDHPPFDIPLLGGSVQTQEIKRVAIFQGEVCLLCHDPAPLFRDPVP